MARQAHHANIVREVFAAELRAQTQVLRFLQQFRFEFQIAERLAMLVAFGRQAIVILGRGQLDGFQRRFRRGAADDERHVVRRASRGAQRAHLVDQVVFSLPGDSSALVS